MDVFLPLLQDNCNNGSLYRKRYNQVAGDSKRTTVYVNTTLIVKNKPSNSCDQSKREVKANPSGQMGTTEAHPPTFGGIQ